MIFLSGYTVSALNLCLSTLTVWQELLATARLGDAFLVQHFFSSHRDSELLTGDQMAATFDWSKLSLVQNTNNVTTLEISLWPAIIGGMNNHNDIL